MPLAKYPDQRPGGRRHARRGGRGRSGSIGTLAALVVASAVAAGPAPAAWATARGSSGSLVLKGFLAGTLKVPAFLPPGKIFDRLPESPPHRPAPSCSSGTVPSSR